MKSSSLQRVIASLYQHRQESDMPSHISHIDPRAILGVSMVYLVAMLSVPLESLGMLLWFAIYPIITSPLAHISFERLFVKSLYVIPLLVLIAVFNPVYNREVIFIVGSIEITQGWIQFVSVVLRGLMSVQALLLLIRVVGFNKVCESLRSFKVPSVITTQLSMVYRFMIVILEEAESMNNARKARGYGRDSYKATMWGLFVGQLLLRSIDRARRVHLAMIARGYNGTLVYCNPRGWTTADTVYCFVWISIILFLRFCDISSLFKI